MVDLNERKPFPARGAFARVRSTGQVVKVAEQGRGDDWMVRPAYRSDGFWIGSADLDPSRDPHAWTPGRLMALLAVSAVAVLLGVAAGHRMVTHGVPWGDAVVQAGVPSGALSWYVLMSLAGLNRP